MCQATLYRETTSKQKVTLNQRDVILEAVAAYMLNLTPDFKDETQT
jgi:hypothetical protein